MVIFHHFPRFPSVPICSSLFHFHSARAWRSSRLRNRGADSRPGSWRRITDHRIQTIPIDSDERDLSELKRLWNNLTFRWLAKFWSATPLLMAFHGFSICNWLTMQMISFFSGASKCNLEDSGSIGSSEYRNVQNAIRNSKQIRSVGIQGQGVSREMEVEACALGRDIEFLHLMIRTIFTSTAHLKWFCWSFGLYYLDTIQILFAGI